MSYTDQSGNSSIVMFSILLFIAGVVLSLNTLMFISSAEEATGTVVYVSNVSKANKGFETQIQVQRKNGEQFIWTKHENSKNTMAKLRTGDQFSVLFDPDNPLETAQINKVHRIWLFPGICFLMSIMFFALRNHY